MVSHKSILKAQLCPSRGTPGDKNFYCKNWHFWHLVVAWYSVCCGDCYGMFGFHWFLFIKKYGLQTSMSHIACVHCFLAYSTLTKDSVEAILGVHIGLG